MWLGARALAEKATTNVRKELLARQVIGWSLRQSMVCDIFIDMRRMARVRRCPSKQAGLIFRGCRGSSYAIRGMQGESGASLRTVASASCDTTPAARLCLDHRRWGRFRGTAFQRRVAFNRLNRHLDVWCDRVLLGAGLYKPGDAA